MMIMMTVNFWKLLEWRPLYLEINIHYLNTTILKKVLMMLRRNLIIILYLNVKLSLQSLFIPEVIKTNRLIRCTKVSFSDYLRVWYVIIKNNQWNSMHLELWFLNQLILTKLLTKNINLRITDSCKLLEQTALKKFSPSGILEFSWETNIKVKLMMFSKILTNNWFFIARDFILLFS